MPVKKYKLQSIEEDLKDRCRISEWVEFQVWKFLHLQKLAHGKKSLVYLGPHRKKSLAFCGPMHYQGLQPFGGKLFIPRGNLMVKFLYLKPTAHSKIVFL